MKGGCFLLARREVGEASALFHENAECAYMLFCEWWHTMNKKTFKNKSAFWDGGNPLYKFCKACFRGVSP